MRNCVAAGASGVVLVNTEDSRFLAAPGEGVPFVCVSSSDGASLRPGASASISPLPLAHGTPLFPLTQPLLPGASSPLQISQAEQESLLAHTGQPGPSVEVATVLCERAAGWPRWARLQRSTCQASPAAASQPCAGCGRATYAACSGRAHPTRSQSP